MLKNKTIALILSLTLLLPVYAVGEDSADITEPAGVKTMETINDTASMDLKENSLNEIKVPKTPEQNLSKKIYKQPASKKKTAKKFILAMLGVAISSFIIYFGLTVYNKIRDGFSAQTPDYHEKEKLLESPEDITDAVKSFLNKNNW